MGTPYASSHFDAAASNDAATTKTLLAIAIVWLAAALALSASGFLLEYPRILGLFVVIPTIAFVIAFAVLPRLRAWAFALDPTTLVFAQLFRVAGGAFLAVYAVGKLNGKFALWAGLLDCAVGISAPFAALYLTPPRTKMQRNLLIAWMVPGILDFFVAIPLAILSRREDPASMMAFNILPLSMIALYFVPLALMDYFVLGAQLWRLRGQQ
jgi:hypothetical protein